MSITSERPTARPASGTTGTTGNAGTADTTDTTGTGTGGQQGPDLTLFLLGHRVFRHEFARLAVAAATAPDPKVDPDRKDAIEDQIAMMLRSLHHHHTGEDLRIWPVLRERDPAAAVVLDRLEAEHEQIDPLIAVAGDRSMLLPDRAPALAELSRLLNVHLDHEEADAVPLLRRHFTREEWEADAKEHLKHVRRDMPYFVGTMTDHMSPEEVTAMVDGAPRILAVLYRLSWKRRWERRRRLVHGR